jgi:hypothetical protein
LIPLPPIGFYTKTYCREHHLKYETEHQKVIDYLKKLDLKNYIGAHDPKPVVVLADSGYDNKDIENTIDRKKWTYIIAIKKSTASKPKHNMPMRPNRKDGVRASRCSKTIAGSSGSLFSYRKTVPEKSGRSSAPDRP